MPDHNPKSSQSNQLRNNALAAGFITAMTIVGAFLSRWHGGGFIKHSPKILKALLWSLPFSLVCGAFWWVFLVWYFVALLAVGVLAWCMVFKNTGHGGGMDLAQNKKEPGAGREPEKLEYLILWLHGKIPQYWYDFLLLAIIGLFSMLAPAVALGWLWWPAGVLTALGGLLGKPGGYALGWAIFPTGKAKSTGINENINEATALGELFTGLFCYLAFSISAVALWVHFYV